MEFELLYTHIVTGEQDTKEGWIASYAKEELEKRNMTAEEAFFNDDGNTLI